MICDALFETWCWAISGWLALFCQLVCVYVFLSAFLWCLEDVLEISMGSMEDSVE